MPHLLPILAFVAIMSACICWIDWSARRDAARDAARYQAIRISAAKGAIIRLPLQIDAHELAAARLAAAGLWGSAALERAAIATLTRRLDVARATLAAA